MKNILKYLGMLTLVTSMCVCCQQNESFDTTIDASKPLIYLHTNLSNSYHTLVKHTPVGSFYQFDEKFPVLCNTTLHGDLSAIVEIDNSVIETYNIANHCNYKALPSELIALENNSLYIKSGENSSTDSLRVYLKGDLEVLTDSEGYIVPLRITQTTGLPSSQTSSVVNVIIATEKNIVRPIKTTREIYGTLIADRSGWTADVENPQNLFDGSVSTASDMNGEKISFTVDMQKTYRVSAVKLDLNYYTPLSIGVEYSQDGTTFEQGGTAHRDEFVFEQRTTPDWVSYNSLNLCFHGAVESRYMRITLTFDGPYQTNLLEYNIYQSEDGDSPMLFVNENDANTVIAKVEHTPIGSFGGVNTEISVRCSKPISEETIVKLEIDNGLVGEYNTKNATAYAPLPDGYIDLDRSVVIPSMSYVSSNKMVVSLVGDMSKLTNKDGYLIPLRVKSSQMATSSTLGVLYQIINVADNNFRDTPKLTDITGALFANRSSWTAKDATGGVIDFGKIFDGDETTGLPSDTKELVVDFGTEFTFDAVRILCTSAKWSPYYMPKNINIQVSSDNVTFTNLGIAGETYQLRDTNGFQTCVLYTPVKARYAKIEMSEAGYFQGLAEFDIYAK